MASILTEKAVVGRRILFTYYRDLKRPDAPAHPGIITGLVPTQGASLKIRLDGKRSSLHSPPDYEGLRYLDEVLDPVPGLPMGRFHPTPDQLNGVWEGVPVCWISEDGDLILLTTDRDAAVRAATANFTEVGVDPAYVDFEGLQLVWAYFEWQPEDADSDWRVRFTSEGDDQAIQLYYLPA
jgi:hypothetical protein